MIITINDLVKAIRELIPQAEIAKDINGQIIIYTGLKKTKDNLLVSIEEE